MDYPRIEHCGAAEDRERFAKQEGIHHLIAGKAVNFFAESDRRAKGAAEVLNFVAEVRGILEPHEVSSLDGLLDERSAKPRIGHLVDDFGTPSWSHGTSSTRVSG